MIFGTFAFDLMLASDNITRLLPPAIIIAGLAAVVGLFLMNRTGAAIGAFLAAAFIYYILSTPGAFTNLGQGIAQTLTVIPGKAAVTTTTNPANTSAVSSGSASSSTTSGDNSTTTSSTQ